jgi:hypothetical protein
LLASSSPMQTDISDLQTIIIEAVSFHWLLSSDTMSERLEADIFSSRPNAVEVVELDQDIDQ